MPLIKSVNAPSSLEPFSLADIERHAKTILLRARAQAERLLAEAQVEGVTIREQARAQGFSEGRERGLTQGLEEGRHAGQAQALQEHRGQLQQSVQALTAALGQFDAARADLEASALAEVVKLAMAIARRITRRQAMVDPEVLAANLREAMALTVKSCDLRVAIHPSQRQALDAALPQLQLQSPNLVHVRVVEDTTIAPGGCRIFTAQGEVDADIESQLDRIAVELFPSPVAPVAQSG